MFILYLPLIKMYSIFIKMIECIGVSFLRQILITHSNIFAYTRTMR